MSSENRIKILAVAGPTASGKTALAVALAKAYNGEVISCDSMQIYRHMAIATAKPTPAAMQGVPHHLIDFLEPEERFSVADYVALAAKAAEEICARGKFPILCGGTGLYFSAFIDGLRFSEAGSDEDYRRQLEERAAAEGAAVLLEELRGFDPESAAKLHPHNLKRIIRAMEHYKLTGETITEQNAKSTRIPSAYDPLILGIGFHERAALYERINTRVDKMMAQGLLEEAEWYFSQKDLATASAAIGYKELQPYFDGSCSLEEAVENLKKETRHYAKRQITWFKRDERIHWIFADEAKQSLFEQAQSVISQEKFLP